MQRDTQNGLTRREALKRGAVIAGGLAWATPLVQAVGMRPAFAATTSPLCRVIDFEAGPNSGTLFKGNKIGNLTDELQPWADWGVTMTSIAPANHPLMIFDSANPTGGDPDLQTPGTGTGNTEPQRNVLIISEDGDSSDPDDDAGGGTMVITFNVPVQITTLGLLDIESTSTNVKAFDAETGGTLLTTVNAQDLADNSFQVIDVSTSGVRRLEVQFAGSGALTDFEFCTTV